MRATGQSVAAHVGNRIRHIRTEAGITLEQLAEAIGATVEELYRHEQGVEPVSPLRLLALSAALDTPIPGFFAGLGTGDPSVPGVGTAELTVGSVTREPAAPPASSPRPASIPELAAVPQMAEVAPMAAVPQMAASPQLAPVPPEPAPVDGPPEPPPVGGPLPPHDGWSSDLARRALAHAANHAPAPPGECSSVDVINAFVRIPNRDLRRDLLQVLQHFC